MDELAVPLKITAIFALAGIVILAASYYFFASEMKTGFAEGMNVYFLAAFLFAALFATYSFVREKFEPPKKKEDGEETEP